MEAQPERVAAAKPKRRWFQFSLATLLLLTLVCAVLLALFVVPAERQRRSAAFIESLGGYVQYSDEGDKAALAPAWLREWLGQDHFQSVRAVDLSETHISDAGLAHLKGLTALKRLDLGATQVSDAGMEHLRGLTGLKVLYLGDTQVSDAGLSHLHELTTLEELYLIDTPVSDAGTADLRAALPNCLIVH